MHAFLKYSVAVNQVNPCIDCPPTLVQPSTPMATWTLDRDRVGLPQRDDAETIRLAPATLADHSALPVYRQSGGAVAVATGRLFVRVARSRQVDVIAGQLQALGLEIVDNPRWAPHTGWVASRDGTPATALRALAEVVGIDAVEYAEAQLLAPRESR